MREETIDIAKGIGIFLVVLGHFTECNSLLYHYIYLFHMPMFFFLSGMFFHKTELSTFLKKKSKRLLYPFVFYWMFSRLVNILSSFVMTKSIDLSNIDWNILHCGPLWFLLSLWTAFLICTIVESLKVFKWGIYIILFSIGLFLGYNKIQLLFYISQTLLLLPFFLFGKEFYQAKIRDGYTAYDLMIKSEYVWGTLFVSFVVYIIPCDSFDFYALVFPHNVQFFIVPIAGILMVLCACKIFCAMWKKIGIEKLGQLSLNILGIHYPLVSIAWFFTIPLCMRLLGYTDGISIKSIFWIQLVLSIVTTTLSCYLGKLFLRVFLFFTR